MYFQFFKFHILGFDTQSVGSGINLGASCCRQHLKLIWSWREGDIRIHQCCILRVCNRHAGCYGFSSSVLVTETKGILLSKTRGDDECGGITHRFSYNLFRLVDRSRACLCVLWQLFFRQFGNGVGVQCAPVDGNGFQLLGGEGDTATLAGYGDTTQDGLSSLHLREGDVELAVDGLGCDHPFQRTAIACLGPWIQVVDDGLSVNRHVEDAQSFVICRFRDVTTMPRLHEIEFHAVFCRCIRDGEVIPQAMATEAEILEQFIALRAADVCCDMALAGLQGIDALEVLSPGMAMQGVVSQPFLSEFILEGIASAVDAVEVVIVRCSLYEVYVPVGCGFVGCCGTATHITAAVHIVSWGRLLPGCDQSFVVDRTNLVNAAIGSVWLYASGIVVRVENPLEMSADAVLGIFCQTGFSLQQFRE